MKALILTCSTGEGHNSAAHAIADALSSENIEFKILDPLTLSSQKVSINVSSAYNRLISRAPSIFGLIYTLGGIYESSRLPNPVYKANASYAKKLYELIKTEKYDFVIATHLFAMEAMTEIKKKYDKNIKSYGVLTDYTTIPFYNETDLDAYFVPTDSVKFMLAEKGINLSKIIVTGIPVKKKFSSHLDREEAKEKIGIEKGRKLVSLMSGGAGCGKILSLVSNFTKKLPENTEIFVFPGKNKKLEKKLNKKFKKIKNVKVISFTPEIDIYMKASDVILSKPGGLSSTEIAVVGIPFVHLKAVPGCESANILYFGIEKMSLPAKTVKSAVNSTLLLLENENLANLIVENQNKLIKKNSAELICNYITSQEQNQI